MQETLHAYCMRTGAYALLRQWDFVRNGAVTPDQISYGSKRKVWWHCEHGHIWSATPTARTSGGSGCPYCAGTRPVPGQTDLASQYPALARQWHPVKNQPLLPTEVLPGSHRKVWWLCPKGHEWQAQIKSRVSGCNCPVCANRMLIPGENDLNTVHPELAQQWHPTCNGTLTPRQVLPGSHRKVWWLCSKGHTWQAEVAARVSGNGCPICAGKRVLPGENDLASLFPEIAKQWHPTRNGTLTPHQVSPYSNRKVWWQCELGHSYQAVIGARTIRISGCPYCAGKKVLAEFNDLATVDPELAAQWHPTLNGHLTPEMVTASSHRMVWWECSLGHAWKAVIYSRSGLKRCGCPVCAGNIPKQPHRKATPSLFQVHRDAHISHRRESR